MKFTTRILILDIFVSTDFFFLNILFMLSSRVTGFSVFLLVSNVRDTGLGKLFSFFNFFGFVYFLSFLYRESVQKRRVLD